MTKAYGPVPLFRDVSFDVPAGTATALVGPNGTGKSTLLRCVLGTERFDDGVASLDGEPLDERDPAVRASVAASIEELSAFAELSVLEHLDLLACAHDVERPSAAVDAVLDETGLAAVAHQLPVTLSSGQRQRLALASCLVRPRRVLMLDEPEQSLDTDGRAWLAERLRRETRDGVAVLFACHDGALIEHVADDVVRLGT
ncbi:ABC transporter ATP-binding protein [Pseudonocardia endophytica]|uniref:ABC transporter ATP-binding protein n=1 Tax=Pseudonocardia endophytica TaxID=401976 RepID=UPI001A9EF600|nr:ABC transporter ATP-binding protein [Pseudonocardia endophytica]